METFKNIMSVILGLTVLIGIPVLLVILSWKALAIIFGIIIGLMIICFLYIILNWGGLG